MKNSKQIRRFKGFTLIELLVVITIVVILAALTFAGASKAVRASKAAGTVSNLRQVHMGILGVKDEGLSNNGYNTPGIYPPYAGQVVNPFAGGHWVEMVGEHLGLTYRDGGKWIWKSDPAESIFQNPLSDHKLGREKGTGPAIQPFSTSSGVGSNWGTYAYNNKIGDWIHSNPDNQGDKPRVSDEQIQYPESTILVGEAPNNPTAPAIASWQPGMIEGSYKKGAHCLFVDGHISLINNKKLADNYEHYTALNGAVKLDQP